MNREFVPARQRELDWTLCEEKKDNYVPGVGAELIAGCALRAEAARRRVALPSERQPDKVILAGRSAGRACTFSNSAQPFSLCMNRVCIANRQS